MLENIIGQTNIVTTLKTELREGIFPSAVLFSGPQFSGKLSTALEVARVLTCSGSRADWDCPCLQCRKQRLLTHPYTLLLGSRYFNIEIVASADVLRRTRKTAAQYLFIRAVRKLTRRFDPVIWEGEETKLRSVRSEIIEIEEQLDSFTPESSINPDNKNELEKRLESIISLSRKVSKILSVENIPINQIRKAASWMHMTAGIGSGNFRKIVILENADKMHDASSNSLLKLLEEPPPNVFLILITTRKGAIIPTVLSRLRPYSFLERKPGEDLKVLDRIFREDGYQSLRDYFLYWKDLNVEQLKTLVNKFMEAVIAKKNADSININILDEMKMLLSPKSARESITAFFEELLIYFHTSLKNGSIPHSQLAVWTKIVHEHYDVFFRFNQSPGLALESLYYRLGAE